MRYRTRETGQQKPGNRKINESKGEKDGGVGVVVGGIKMRESGRVRALGEFGISEMQCAMCQEIFSLDEAHGSYYYYYYLGQHTNTNNRSIIIFNNKYNN